MTVARLRRKRNRLSTGFGEMHNPAPEPALPRLRCVYRVSAQATRGIVMSRKVAPEACRVSVHCDTGKADLVLPAGVAVATIIPAIVDQLVSTSDRRRWNGAPSDWQLATIEGRALLPGNTLHDNHIRDGDILWLRSSAPAEAPPASDDAIGQIVTSLDALPRWSAGHSRTATIIGGLCCTGVIAYVLVRDYSSASATCAGLLAAISLMAAVRIRTQRQTKVMLGTCASVFAAVAAYLVVPGDATAPKLMLAGAAAATAAVLTARYTCAGTTIFAGIAIFGVLSGTAACAHLLLSLRTPATGAGLVVASVAALIVGPRLAVWTTRLPIPALEGGAEEPPDLTQHARRAHAVVTGLVSGCAGAAAVGAALAVGGTRPCDAALAVTAGLVLMLRAGRHADLAQTAALLACGATCLGATFLWAVHLWPHIAHWTSLAAGGLAAASIAMQGKAPKSAVFRRCVELIENGGIAALIPLACWACGVFSAARGLRLS
jgi:type VII secretion integral membrane protein EccD